MDSSPLNANNATHAVLHTLDESDKEYEKILIDYCASFEHAQAIALQGMSAGWQNVTIVDLKANKR